MNDWFRDMLSVLIRQFVKPKHIYQAQQWTDIVLEVCHRTVNKQHPINLDKLFAMAGMPDPRNISESERAKNVRTELNTFDYTFRRNCYNFYSSSEAQAYTIPGNINALKPLVDNLKHRHKNQQPWTEKRQQQIADKLNAIFFDFYVQANVELLTATAKRLLSPKDFANKWIEEQILQIAEEIKRILNQQKKIISEEYTYFSLEVRLSVVSKLLEILSVADIIPSSKNLNLLRAAISLDHASLYQSIDPNVDHSFYERYPIYLAKELIKLIRQGKKELDKTDIAKVITRLKDLEKKMKLNIFRNKEEILTDQIHLRFNQMLALMFNEEDDRELETAAKLITYVNAQLGGSVNDRAFFEKYRSFFTLRQQVNKSWSAQTYLCFLFLLMVIYLKQDEHFSLHTIEFAHPLLMSIHPDLVKPGMLKDLEWTVLRTINFNTNINLEKTGRFFIFRNYIPASLRRMKQECEAEAQNKDCDEFLEAVQNSFDREKLISSLGQKRGC